MTLINAIVATTSCAVAPPRPDRTAIEADGQIDEGHEEAEQDGEERLPLELAAHFLGPTASRRSIRNWPAPSLWSNARPTASARLASQASPSALVAPIRAGDHEGGVGAKILQLGAVEPDLVERGADVGDRTLWAASTCTSVPPVNSML